MQLYSKLENGETVEVNIRLVAELGPTDVMYLQIFNIIVRKCLENMQLEEMGRNFYDRHQAIRIEAHHLELWPGYKTSMRNHEHDILLGVEITHKVLRLDNCLHVFHTHMDRPDGRVTFEFLNYFISEYFHFKIKMPYFIQIFRKRSQMNL